MACLEHSALRYSRIRRTRSSCTLVLGRRPGQRCQDLRYSLPGSNAQPIIGSELRVEPTNMPLLLVPFWLHKALPVPFLPLGFCILLGSIGLLLRKRWITWSAFALLWGFSTHPIASWLVTSLESRYPALEVTGCPQADAVVVLSGMLRGSVTSATEWKREVDRFERGVELVAGGRAPKLLFTRGVSWPDVGREPEGLRLAREAAKHGIPAGKIELTDDPVLETSGEVRSIRRTMEKHGWHRIILVTSAIHMPRAMWLVKKEHIDAIPFPADFEAESHGTLDLGSFLPQAKLLEESEGAIREWIGLAYYRVFGV
jgi:uncharacterized SAM-binding protein YcdF (DUF218 family)